MNWWMLGNDKVACLPASDLSGWSVPPWVGHCSPWSKNHPPQVKLWARNSRKTKRSQIQICLVLWGAGPELTQSFTCLLWRLLPTRGLWQTSAMKSDLWKRKCGPSPFSVTHYHTSISIWCSEQADFHMTVLLQWGWIMVDFGVF